ncbi:hypothetical protein P186_0664 [Pyrobaculum ferrireducens]|uniref:Uncharacterized protein n=2 Tax=Pyrobaculum ferrireducens TaxID=1104324 RepID=G7VHU3_9CREN|nr:hypothetical protein P186_0664 [Pyrobaculum ferrireducens]
MWVYVGRIMKLVKGLRWVLLTAVVTAGVMFLWVGWPEVIQYPSGYTITYNRGIGQEVTLEVVNDTGHPVHFCASIFGWYPNGSVVKLDDVCARGVGKIKTDAVRKYAEQWKDLDGEIGVFVILTYINGTDSKGNYTFDNAVKGFTIRPKRVVAGENIKATIKVKAKPPKEKSVSRASAAILQWPPKSVPTGEQCFPAVGDPNPVTTCYNWALETTYVSATNTPVPVVVARVSSSDAYNLHTVRVALFLAASSQYAVSFSGGSMLTTKNADGSEVTTGFSADIVTLAVTSDLYLDDYYSYTPYQLGPRIIAIGFYGDYAVVRYRKQACTYTCVYLNDYAYMYLVRPRIPITVYKDMQPLDGNLGNVFSMVSSNWAGKTIYGASDVSISATSVVGNSGGISLLSMSVPLLSRPNIPLSAVFSLAASLGSQSFSAARGEVYATLQTNDPRVTIYAVYYRPNPLYEFNNQYYPLPSLFVDVKTYKTSGLGEEPEG